MIEDEANLHMIQAAIEALPEAKQALVRSMARKIQDMIRRDGQYARMAVALIGAQIALEAAQ